MSRSRIEWLARPGTIPEIWNPNVIHFLLMIKLEEIIK